MKFFNRKPILNDKESLINSYFSYRSLIKKLITVGLISLFIFFIISLSSCSMKVRIPVTKEENTSVMSFNKGWYIYKDDINEPLYLFYENEDEISRLGTFKSEVKGKEKENAQDTFKFYRVINNLTYLRDADPLMDIPFWAIDFIYKDYETYKNKILGFSCPFTVKDIQDPSSFYKPSFFFFQKNDCLTYETSYYKVDNDFYYPLDTKKPLSLYVVCEDPLFGEYFSVSNKKGGTVLEGGDIPLSKLTNSLTFKSLKNRKGKEEKTFIVEVHNKERGEDSFMFNLYLKL